MRVHTRKLPPPSEVCISDTAWLSIIEVAQGMYKEM
jgi:hypothetical protein